MNVALVIQSDKGRMPDQTKRRSERGSLFSMLPVFGLS
jgi:hypothetical protein